MALYVSPDPIILLPIFSLPPPPWPSLHTRALSILTLPHFLTSLSTIAAGGKANNAFSGDPGVVSSREACSAGPLPPPLPPPQRPRRRQRPRRPRKPQQQQQQQQQQQRSQQPHPSPYKPPPSPCACLLARLELPSTWFLFQRQRPPYKTLRTEAPSVPIHCTDTFPDCVRPQPHIPCSLPSLTLTPCPLSLFQSKNIPIKQPTQ